MHSIVTTFREAVIEVEVANFDAAMDTLIDQDDSYSASHNNWCTVGRDGGYEVGEVRAGTTFPMPDHKGFKLCTVTCKFSEIYHFKG